MSYSPPVPSVQLPVEPNKDDELSCLVCNRDGCEWAVVVRGGGRRTWIGIHGKCARAYREPEFDAGGTTAIIHTHGPRESEQ